MSEHTGVTQLPLAQNWMPTHASPIQPQVSIASHSASQLICGDGVALRMSHFADVTKSELRGDLVFVQPGVRMIELGDWLYERSLSIGCAHIGFRGALG